MSEISHWQTQGGRQDWAQLIRAIEQETQAIQEQTEAVKAQTAALVDCLDALREALAELPAQLQPDHDKGYSL